MNDIIFLIQASGITFGIAICALVLGLILALLLTASEMAPWKFIRWISIILSTTLRSLPEILVVLFVYYGSSQLLLWISDGIALNLYFFTLNIQMNITSPEVSPFICGVIALALLYSAYAVQTLRGALKAVPLGQREAGLALGLSKSTIFFRLVMPQMWRHALPGLGNQWLVLLKDTALVSLISVNDLMLQAQSIATRTQKPFTWYIAAAIIYLIITLFSQQILKYLERRTTHFERRTN